jgi:TonB family protein
VSQTRRPPYPPLAVARGVSGTVWLNALVDETGRAVEIALVRTSAPGLGFEDAAMTHVHSRAYRPATKQGVPVRVRLPITVEFQAPER